MKRRRFPYRSGNVLMFTALLMIAMFAFIAFAADLGYLYVVRAELQRSADAAAIASAWELIDEGTLSGASNPTTTMANARTLAGQYSGQNTVGGAGVALAVDDVQIGQLANPSDRSSAMTFTDPSRYNAVHLRLRRTVDQNGEVPLFFARVMGINSHAAQAEATAAFLSSFAGFEAPSSGENLQILPFALDKPTWDAMKAGGGTDSWSYDPETRQVSAGSDGIREVNLYPAQSSLPPGNRGTVDIGSSNNSTADIARQILYGISAADLAYHGGSLRFNESGELSLNGDTGISAGVKDELASIKGQPRMIPLFTSVTGPGNNAQYTIVKFVGVRILDVKLTGSMSSKRVIVQPACVKTKGGIAGTAPTADFIYSPVWLVR